MNPKKPEFLEARNKARKEASKPVNIAAGWKATGIHPRDRLKPLNSRLAYQRDQDLPGRPSTPERMPPKADTLAAMSAMVFQTPRSTSQVNKMAKQLCVLEPGYGFATFRLFVRKLGKSLSQATGQISSLKFE